MFYDDLCLLKEKLELALIQISHDRTKTVKQRIGEKEEIIRRIILIDQKLKDIVLNRVRYQKTYHVDEVRLFKKEVKHEFLVQVLEGYSMEEICRFIQFHMDNPGLHVEKYIQKLRYDDKTQRGYFVCDSKGNLCLTRKAFRYLENTANVSLKR